MSLAAWYQQQYANTPLGRTTRGRMVPFLANSDRGIPEALQRLGSQQAGQAQQMPNPNLDGTVRKEGEEGREKKTPTLFGPPVGNVGTEERKKWGIVGEGREELPPEVLKKWMGKSAEASVPTTTLQALTNLKRPSIRLSPLHTAHSPSSSTPPPPDPLAPHGLEFTYDADCPFVRITVRVLPPTNFAVDHPTMGEEVFTTVAKGGFGQVLGPEANAVVELGKYEQHPVGSEPSSTEVQLAQRVPVEQTPSGSQTNIASPTPARAERRRFSFLLRSHRHSTAAPSTPVPPAPPRTRGPALPVVDALAAPADPGTPTTPPPNASPDTTTTPAGQAPITPQLAAQLGFHVRPVYLYLLQHGRAADARALLGRDAQVVDAAERQREEARDRERREEETSGVRVGIWVEGLGEDGKDLPVRNAQATFLHVHRVGARPRPPTPPVASEADASAIADGDLESGLAQVQSRSTAAAPEPQVPVVDTRPWLVKVVHREAIIGKRTFTLHEIYGLASSASDPHPPPSTDPRPPLPNPHTYPPTSPAPHHDDDDSPHAPECILCLSSPRSVVLMPCRHLVACKECALNMLEFGAGGSIYHPPEDGEAGAGGAGGSGNGNGGSGGGGALGQGGPPPAPRRKRKVKGWFCPICRQPYTSMLRISLQSPEGELVAELENESEDPLGGAQHVRASTSTVPVGWKAHQEEENGEAEQEGEGTGTGTPGSGEAPEEQVGEAPEAREEASAPAEAEAPSEAPAPTAAA